MATEEPKFDLLAQQNHIELRRYPVLVAAETFVEGDMDAASGKGFRAIADYVVPDRKPPFSKKYACLIFRHIG